MGEIDAKENFIRLVDQYKNLIFSVCLKFTGDYFTSEDITQETFLAAYQHLEEFDGSNEKAWLCRIASNKCIDYLRKAERKYTFTEEEELLEKSDSEYEPLKMYLGKTVVEEVNLACEKLPIPYSEVAQKFFIQGFTAKEIADKKGMNRKTIQTQICRAREMLKKTIRREDLLS